MTHRVYYILKSGVGQVLNTDSYFGEKSSRKNGRVLKTMKKIAVINDLSGFGKCSLTVAIPVISALGLECCPMPTAVLSNQTGFESFYCDDFTDKMDFFTSEWKKLGVRFDGILTGFIASHRQAEKIFRFLDEFQNDDTVFFCDPVMADDGKIYDIYDKAMCDAVTRLAKRADIISPNLTELCVLTGESYEALSSSEPDDIAKAASSLLNDTLSTVIVTGIKKDDTVLNVVADKSGFKTVSSKKYGGSFSGTGDLFAAAVAGLTVKGEAPLCATEKAVEFLEGAIRDSYEENTDRNFGVNFEKYLGKLM